MQSTLCVIIGNVTKKPGFTPSNATPAIQKIDVGEIIGIVASVFVAIAMAMCLFRLWKNKCRRNSMMCIKQKDYDYAEDEIMNDGYDNVKMSGIAQKTMKGRANSTIDFKSQINLVSCDSKREIPRSCFEITKQIGSGNLGTVSKGELHDLYHKGSKTVVAIKATKGPTEGVKIRDLLHEIKIMSHIKPNLNVVSMIGSCSTDLDNRRELWLITEFCHHGELKGYLIENQKQLLSGAEDDLINSRCLLNWSHDIAKGMDFLSSNNIMHGDLGAGNVMLDGSPIQAGLPVAKVAGFGLSKKLETGQNYEKEERVYVPWKWMAIEYLTSDYLTMTSDVWSFGVFLWEMFSCGQTPYGNQDFNDVMTLLEEGPLCPLPCPLKNEAVAGWDPEELYHELSNMCFVRDPNERATFSKVSETIEKRLTEKEMLYYANMEEKYQSEYCNAYLKFAKSS